MTRKQRSRDLFFRPELTCPRLSDSWGIAKIKPAPARFSNHFLTEHAERPSWSLKQAGPEQETALARIIPTVCHKPLGQC